MLVATVLRAEGIALSHDGRIWLEGGGEYGGGWGPVGKGISVRQGGTFYVRYYSRDRTNGSLHFAHHGAEWGSWNSTGPALTGGVGDRSTNVVVLKFSNAGTPKSTAVWVDGSGTWRGLSAVGAYDLALHEHAVWTLPPITIVGVTPPGFWAGVAQFFRGNDTAISTTGDVTTRSFELSVPDGGGTAALLGTALIGIAVFWRAVHKRRLRERAVNRAPSR